MKRIVLVEDDESVRDIFHILFKTIDVEIINLETGEDIISSDLDRPDLFVLERQIPGISGLEVCGFIKNSEKYKGVPVIMFSESPDIIRMAKEAGADDAISKPFSLRKMRETVLSYVM